MADQFVPHVVVTDGAAAVKFYREVFGGTEGEIMMDRDGKRLLHGEVVLDGHKVFVSDEFADEEGGSLRVPQKLGGTCVRITVMVNDADEIMRRAVSRGAVVKMAVQDMFWGGRYGKFVDPFGHEWGIDQEIGQPTDDEQRAAAEEFFRRQNAVKHDD
jgi:PhnB protein